MIPVKQPNGAAIIQDFLRRDISPDKEATTAHGLLQLWRFNLDYVARLLCGTDTYGPGTVTICGGPYINTYTPDEIADSMMGNAPGIQLLAEHSASSYGVPVFVDEGGNPLDYAAGLKGLRKERGWSIQNLADRAGVSARTVEGWEQGRHMPPKSALLLLQAATGD